MAAPTDEPSRPALLPGQLKGVRMIGGNASDFSILEVLVASGHALTIADASAPDVPLSWANPAFERLTGYALAEVAGRNCRFLQGPDTDAAAVRRIGEALRRGEAVTETLLNYRKDGTSWWNQLTVTPVRDDDGRVVRFVGVQLDVSDRVAVAEERDAARLRVAAADADTRRQQHAMVLALQESLLPALPDVDGLELAARYLPASDTADVGGDWFDVLPIPDGSTGIAVGDVMGHDIRAAAAMGQLRSVLRSYAWEGQGPAEVLDRLNQLVCALGMARLATAIYARIEPSRGSRPVRLQWSNAGHPPPLLLTPDGEVRVLSEALNTPIGVQRGSSAMHGRSTATVELPSRSTVVFYTDGLVEDRSRDVDVGIDALAKALVAAGPDSDVQEVADSLLTAGYNTHQDDQCLLVVRTV